MLDPQPKDFQVHVQAKEGVLSDMIVAARDGETETVRKLLKAGADVNSGLFSEHSFFEHGWTALMWTARGGHGEVVQILLQAGADVEAGGYHLPALMTAARRGHPEVVQILLNAGADANAKDENTGTALMKAAEGGHTEAVRMLLDAGADVNVKGRSGKSALMIATEKGHTHIVGLLREAQKQAKTKMVVYAVLAFVIVILVVYIGRTTITKKDRTKK